ncbi:hypothetical protein CBM2634_A80244 [Cupriavidus taiwanensis]|uniref:Uncharacterized protein n=1 Tax=Cupriavidus taiwanensis TaxID=164546 RepID=A0A375J3U4_9BURK|nr:hypothetical protein CBM2634_A80244 [Cupriavidus taiwanensis]
MGDPEGANPRRRHEGDRSLYLGAFGIVGAFDSGKGLPGAGNITTAEGAKPSQSKGTNK